MKLEYELFQRVREAVLGQLPALPADGGGAGATGRAGRVRRRRRGFTTIAGRKSARRAILHIREGRHPVLEQNLSERTVCAERRRAGPRRRGN